MLTPNRPYLLRAYYEWLLDNDLTPHLVVDAFVPGTQVPQQYVKDGQIVLNVAPSAVMNLEMGNSYVEFNARFGGVPHHILLPMGSVVAIYARENGAGSVFDMEEAFMAPQEDDEELALTSVEADTNEEQAEEPDVVEAEASKQKKPPKKRGHLTVVK
ncbi:ClpXP protease specificity-enhancing factor [Parashewanella curva]|uniref:ClpXP protease specificity-enhancing factor n=1 Tax=Parashewanella curva TaxID=2338552 RepID=A0A3L8Q2Q8_9GAMM|nr:ClpXP protease specificity-enhancing factor [Parashewanella curva]RLV61309.1 ClpXP protease specificity-enhancing factor [Parashewanella curva]